MLTEGWLLKNFHGCQSLQGLFSLCLHFSVPLKNSKVHVLWQIGLSKQSLPFHLHLLNHYCIAGLPRSGKNILENEIFSRSGKSQGILCMAREI